MCGYVKTKEKMHLSATEGRELSMIKEFAAKKGCAVICGGPRSDNEKIYNCAYFISGNDAVTYSKVHLSSFGPVDENELYTAGDEPKIIEHKGMRFGLCISHDIYFPEMFRWYANNGADLIICISAVPEEVRQKYGKMLPARAVENSIPIVFVNMVGSESGTKMAGGSMFITPDGEIEETFGDSSDVRTLRIGDDIKAPERPIIGETRSIF